MCKVRSQGPWLVALACLAGACAVSSVWAKSAGAEPATSTRIPARAQFGATALTDVKLEFGCTTGKGGVLSLSVVLPASGPLREFALDAFEGPHGAGETLPLATWTYTGFKATTVQTTIAGRRDGDGFVLTTSRDSGSDSDVARLLKRFLDANDEPLRLTVNPPGQGGADLKIEAGAGPQRDTVSRLLAPCLVQAQ